MQNKTIKPEKTISPSNLPSIITAVVLIVGIGAVYGLMGYLISGIEENVTPIIQKPTQKPSLEITDWKIYQNEEYGFEINYPENWYYNRDKQVEKKLDYNLHVRFIEDTKTSSQDTHYPDIHYPIEFMIWPDNIGISDSDPCDYEILEKKDEKQYILSTCDFKKYGKIMNKMTESFKFIEKDETADWQTYRNEEYGFEVKYPGDWDNPLWQEDEYKKGITFGCPVFDFEGNEHCSLSLRISEAITKSEAIRNISINIGAYKKEDVIINEGGIPTIKEFTVDTREAITYHDAGICVETYTKIFDSKMTISFTDRCSVYEGKIFDQILSTFKFIEEDETADWQIYRNEEYGFELKYPSNFILRERINEDHASFIVGFIKSIHAHANTVGIYKYNSEEEVEKFKNLSYVKLYERDGYYLAVWGTSNELSDQILSTFKFIEKDETANWEVYRNEEFGFEFKYPEKWELKDYSEEDVFRGHFYFGDNKPGVILIFKYNKETKKNPFDLGQAVISSEKISIGGIGTTLDVIEVDLEYKRPGMSPKLKIATSFEKDDYKFSISFPKLSEEGDKQLELIRNFLFTFKFIEK